ncbi:FkbM family methyltransferase [Sulfurimonas sp. HSL-1716]|uniref:FkbM family methyltransferase n=1 Tax=Hydrocurvibacter sulfurireducens TaxID=3131937 RepID=UPI0031F7321B
MKLLSDEDYIKLRESTRFVENDLILFDKKVYIPDVASFFFLLKEIFQLEIYKFSTRTKKPLIIDCGANIGLSVIYFKRLYPHAKIIAFEPDKEIFKYLKSNVESFGYKDAELINKALWNQETTLRFFSEGADGGRIAADDEKQQIIEVQTVKLSEYLKDVNVDFLKIDIEGAETDVLLECQNELKNVENIFIEYHSFSDKPQTLSTILSILEKNGFRYYIEHIGVKSSHPFESITDYVGFDNQLNIFGYRK